MCPASGKGPGPFFWRMTETDLFLRFGISLAIGILVGMQREYASGNDGKELLFVVILVLSRWVQPAFGNLGMYLSTFLGSSDFRRCRVCHAKTTIAAPS